MDAFLMERLGADYGQKLAALSPKIYPFIAPLVTDISRGEIGLAVGAISEQTLAQMKAGAPLKLVFAPQGGFQLRERSRRDVQRETSQCR
jgi:hypothetical protein